MLNRKKSIVIKDKEFEILLLRVTTALKTAQTLSKFVLPLVGEIFNNGEQTVELENIDFAKVADLLIEQMDEIDFISLAETLLSELKVEGEEVELDTYFIAKYDELVAVLTFALKENYSSFFQIKGLLTE